jgi:hypothetical protein
MEHMLCNFCCRLYIIAKCKALKVLDFKKVGC